MNKMRNINEIIIGNHYLIFGVKTTVNPEILIDVLMNKIYLQDIKGIQFDDTYLDEFDIKKKSEKSYMFSNSYYGFLKTNSNNFEMFCDNRDDDRRWLYSNFRYVHELQNIISVSNRLVISPNYVGKVYTSTFNITIKETTNYI